MDWENVKHCQTMKKISPSYPCTPDCPRAPIRCNKCPAWQNWFKTEWNKLRRELGKK